MDDLTLDQRVRLIEEFERARPRSLRAAAKKAIVVLGAAAAVLALLILVGVVAVARLERERNGLEQDIAGLNQQKVTALEEIEDLRRTRDTLLAANADAQRAVADANRPAISSADRQAALAAADDDLSSAYIVGRSTQIAVDPKQAAPRAELIRRLYSREADERLAAYSALMATSRKDATLVPELLRFAADPDNGADRPNGIYNTLVLLSQLDADVLAPNADAVRQFANDARRRGPRTGARATKLIARLPPEQSR